MPRFLSQNEQSAAPPAIVPSKYGLISMTFLTLWDATNKQKIMRFAFEFSMKMIMALVVWTAQKIFGKTDRCKVPGLPGNRQRLKLPPEK